MHEVDSALCVNFVSRAAGSTWQALDELVRPLVRDKHMLHHQASNARRKEFARRERAEEVAAEGVHARLVECAPVADAGPKRPANAESRLRQTVTVPKPQQCVDGLTW